MQADRDRTVPSRAVSLEEMLREAERHPEVAAAQAEVQVAQGGVVTADRAPLPQVSLSLGSIDLQNGLGPGSILSGKRIDKGVGVDWTLERGGKRTLRTRGAELVLEAARQDRIETLIQRRLATSSAFWDLLAAQERESVATENLRSARQVASLSQTRFERGDISEQEVSRALIEAERARSELAATRAARELAAIALAQSAGIKDPRLAAQPTWPVIPDPLKRLSVGLAEIAQARPDVQAAIARAKAARFGLDLAQSLQTNDVTLGAGFNNYPPDQRAMLQVRAQFAWQVNHRYEGEIRQAAAVLLRAEEQVRLATQSALADLLTLDLRRVQAAERLAAFETEIRARARRVLERAEAAYARGATPLTELLEARRTHLAVELDAVQARAEAARALTEWQLRSERLEP